MPTTALAPPLFWRMRPADDTGDERFLIAFFFPVAGHDASAVWSCDGIARSEPDARDYALEHGVSADSFTEALKRVRRGVAFFERPSSP
jgi:hypothetical protein